NQILLLENRIKDTTALLSRTLPGVADLASQPCITRWVPRAAPGRPWPGPATALCQNASAFCRALPHQPGKQRGARCRPLPRGVRPYRALPPATASAKSVVGKLGVQEWEGDFAGQPRVDECGRKHFGPKRVQPPSLSPTNPLTTPVRVGFLEHEDGALGQIRQAAA